MASADLHRRWIDVELSLSQDEETMNIRTAKSQHGFTLLELMVASAIGLVLILAATSLFKMGMDATFTVTQRAETQQNMRAAVELITKDISLAGAGLPSGGIQLPTNAVSQFACNQTGTCYVPAHNYPNNATGGINYMYGIIPGFNNGVQNNAVIPSAPGQINSSITSIYCDYNFPLSNFTFTFAGATSVTVGVVNGAVQPNSILAPGGLNAGDLMLFVVSGAGNPVNGNTPVQTAAGVGEITTLPNANTITFNNGDPLNLNQTAGTNNLTAVAAASAAAGSQMTVCRLYAVTYFLQVPPAAGTVQTPRLMRQVNGLTAVPVADNIINLQITYDVIDSNLGTITANQVDPVGAGQSPSLIQKVNIWVIGSSVTQSGRRAQNMYLATSVSARDMSFCNSYSSSNTSCN
jgi:prepilin-type N-terminal cleavage/methylation domain-containing protein